MAVAAPSSASFDVSFECDGAYEIHDGVAIMVRWLSVANRGGAEMCWLWTTDSEGRGHVRVLDTPGWDVTVDRAMWESAPFVRIG